MVATAKSAINVSSVSPDRWEIIMLKFAFFAIEITSKVSVKVPIWLGFIKILLADFSLIPFSSLFEFVTNKSSPTILISFPRVNFSYQSKILNLFLHQ